MLSPKRLPYRFQDQERRQKAGGDTPLEQSARSFLSVRVQQFRDRTSELTVLINFVEEKGDREI
jgi:hypothetical protein